MHVGNNQKLKWETVSIDKLSKRREREPISSEKTAEEMKLRLDLEGFRIDWRGKTWDFWATEIDLQEDRGFWENKDISLCKHHLI